jgi:hypothetical protein
VMVQGTQMMSSLCVEETSTQCDVHTELIQGSDPIIE